MQEVKTAVIPIGGLATRFLPLSKVVPKELWPLVDQPVIQYIITEAKNSGIKNIIFVLKPKNKAVLEYLKPSPKIEKTLKERKKGDILSEVKKLEDFFSDINFSYVLQSKPLGDGHALLQAAKKIKGDESIACLFADDVVESKVPCLAQINKVFQTCQKSVVALYKTPKEKLHCYGVVKVDKIANRVYKIKGAIEKPEPGKEPSDLAIIGKYILTPEFFDYLKKIKPNERGEIIIADTFAKMLKEGKVIYGYEIEGKWLECGNKLDWLKSNLYLSLRHPQFGPELKKVLKEI